MRIRCVRIASGAINTLSISSDNDEEREFIEKEIYQLLKSKLKEFSKQELKPYAPKAPKESKTKRRKT